MMHCRLKCRMLLSTVILSNFLLCVATSPSLSSSSGDVESSSSPLNSPTDASSSVKDLYELTQEFFTWKVQEFPLYASVIGFRDETASHLDCLSPEQFELRRIKCEDFRNRTMSLDTTVFSEDDHLNFRIFLEEIETFINNYDYLKFFAPISKQSNPHNLLYFVLKKSTRLENLNDFKMLVARYKEFPRQAQEIIDIMKDNIANRLMPSNWSLAGVEDQLNDFLVPCNESVFYEPFLNITINITSAERIALKEEALLAVGKLLSSFEKIRDFFKAEYFPMARSEEGVSSLPGGLDYYKACLRYHTSTDLTPQQIHDMGLEEVNRIRQEVDQTALLLNLPNKTLGEISRTVKEYPSQKFSSAEDILSTYRHLIYNTIYPLMDKVVDKLPSVNVSVEENPFGTGWVSYNPAPRDGSRPGTFFINAKIYEQHARYEATALSLHEAVPGHHLQFATILADPSVPEFRKYPDYTWPAMIPLRFPLNTAYVEGWGLYAEFLGEELGLYKDVYQKIGRHSFESLRASRLVVDTGIHALNWTRQQAIDYLLENTAMAEGAIKSQVDRYITAPGQACSYKVGELKIKELRRTAEKLLGNLFLLQDFHEVVLKCAGPLNILEECIHSYVIRTKAT